MKMIFWFLGIILLLVLIQVLYSAYYFRKSSQLVKNPHVGKHELGDKKNSEFRLFFGGDSVAAGIGATSFETSVSGRVANYVARDKFVIFENNAVSGTKMRDLVKRKLPEGKWDLVVLVVSSNDLFRFSNLDEFKTSTEKVLSEYTKIAEKVVIVGPGRVFDSPAVPVILRPIYKWKSQDYIEVIEDEVKTYKNVVYINPVHPPKELKQVENWESPDKFHPGDYGQEYWFEMIKTAL